MLSNHRLFRLPRPFAVARRLDFQPLLNQTSDFDRMMNERRQTARMTTGSKINNSNQVLTTQMSENSQIFDCIDSNELTRRRLKRQRSELPNLEQNNESSNEFDFLLARLTEFKDGFIELQEENFKLKQENLSMSNMFKKDAEKIETNLLALEELVYDLENCSVCCERRIYSMLTLGCGSHSICFTCAMSLVKRQIDAKYLTNGASLPRHFEEDDRLQRLLFHQNKFLRDNPNAVTYVEHILRTDRIDEVLVNPLTNEPRLIGHIQDPSYVPRSPTMNQPRSPPHDIWFNPPSPLNQLRSPPLSQNSQVEEDVNESSQQSNSSQNDQSVSFERNVMEAVNQIGADVREIHSNIMNNQNNSNESVHSIETYISEYSNQTHPDEDTTFMNDIERNSRSIPLRLWIECPDCRHVQVCNTKTLDELKFRSSEISTFVESILIFLREKFNIKDKTEDNLKCELCNEDFKNSSIAELQKHIRQCSLLQHRCGFSKKDGNKCRSRISLKDPRCPVHGYENNWFIGGSITPYPVN